MNTYRIRYKSGVRGIPYVKADTINGFQPNCDTYLFKQGQEIVAAVPKVNVVSVEKIESGDEDPA